MIPAGRVNWPCILGSSNLSTEDDTSTFKGEYRPILKSGLLSMAMELDGIKIWSVSETLDLRLSPPPIVITVTVTPSFPFAQGTDEVLRKKRKPK
jgi:hypothetical protein